MIKIFAILFLLTINAPSGRWSVKDCDLKYRYKKVQSTYDKKMLEIVKMYDHAKYMNGNKAAFIQESIDTLNKSEIVLTKFVESTVLEKEINWIGISGGRKENDTLTIFVGDIVANEQIEHIICNGKVKTYYKEWYKDDNILKMTKDENPTNELKIEVINPEFEICQERNVYYGYCKLQVEPYFRMDKYHGNQFLQIQRNYEYYFKFEIQRK